jgi:hypothetical protein
MALLFPPKVLDHLPILAKAILSAKLFQIFPGQALLVHPNPSAYRRSANSLNSDPPLAFSSPFHKKNLLILSIFFLAQMASGKTMR